MQSVQFFFFVVFVKFVIIACILYSLSRGDNKGDLVAFGYLAISLYFLQRPAVLVKGRGAAFQLLRYFNWFGLFLIVLFQGPWTLWGFGEGATLPWLRVHDPETHLFRRWVGGPRWKRPAGGLARNWESSVEIIPWMKVVSGEVVP